jgi:acetyl-CoA decarbonylase/synthase complex subunit delta
MPIITPVASEVWGVKEAISSEEDTPEWGSQEERGIDMEIETAAAVLASGSNAVILKHPESVKTIKTLINELV